MIILDLSNQIGLVVCNYGMVKKKRLMTTVQTITSNGESSEVVEKVNFYTVRYEVDNFIMLYTDSFFTACKNITSGQQLKLIIYLSAISEWNTGEVIMDSNTRERVCEKLGYTPGSLRTTLVELRKTGIIERVGGRYKVNINVFFRGKNSERKTLIDFEKKRAIQPKEVEDDSLFREADADEFVEGFRFQLLTENGWQDRTWDTALRKEYRGDRLLKLIEDNKVRTRIC